MGFIIREFIWDIPILIFAYVLFEGPILGSSGQSLTQRFHGTVIGCVFLSGTVQDALNPKSSTKISLPTYRQVYVYEARNRS